MKKNWERIGKTRRQSWEITKKDGTLKGKKKKKLRKQKKRKMLMKRRE